MKIILAILTTLQTIFVPISVGQGHVLILLREGNQESIQAFGHTYYFNSRGQAFIGVSSKQIPDTYQIDTRAIKVRWVDFPCECWRKHSTPTKKRQLEIETFRNTFSSLATVAKDLTDAQPYRSPLATPVSDLVVTEVFAPVHEGNDIRTKKYLLDRGFQSVFAVNQGHVVLARRFSGEGNMVAIDHGLGIFSVYMHLSKISVKEGAFVAAGQPIGVSGSTGFTRGPHLDFRINIQDVYVDPIDFIQIANAHLGW